MSVMDALKTLHLDGNAESFIQLCDAGEVPPEEAFSEISRYCGAYPYKTNDILATLKEHELEWV